MFVKNCWYVASWGAEVPSDGLLSRTLIDVPLALWRDSNGKVIAFEDRCCHRGAPLSKGRKEGDCVRCLYHGLKFDATGRCVEIPAQARIPPQAKVRTFPTVERHRWIWVWMGDAALADESLIPSTWWLDHPDWRGREGYLHYEVEHLLIADNLLDLSHLPFLHPTTLGGSPDYAAVLPQVERLERGVRISRTVFNTEPPAYSRAYGTYPEGMRADRWMLYDFLVPGVLLMDTGMSPAGTGLKEGRRVNALEFRSAQALTPESTNSTHYFFTQAHNFLIDDASITDAIHASVLVAFEEDRAMVVAQARNLRRDPAFKMLPLSVDSALSHYRWLLAQLSEREAQQGHTASTAAR